MNRTLPAKRWLEAFCSGFADVHRFGFEIESFHLDRQMIDAESLVKIISNDGQQLGLQGVVSHWNMGRRLLDRVRPVDTRDTLKTVPNPAWDEDVR